MLLATTSVLVYVDARLQGLDHVLRSIDELVDVSSAFLPDRAAAFGSARLLNRVLKRVKADGTDPLLVSNWCKKAMQKAIERKDLKMVECIHHHHPSPLALSSLNLAIAVGSLELVQWMVRHRWDQLCLIEPPGSNEAHFALDCCIRLPSTNTPTEFDIQICRWLYDQGYITSVGRLEEQAARLGDLNTIRWLYEHQVPRVLSDLALTLAIHSGHVDVVQYLYEREEVRVEMPRSPRFEITNKASPALVTYLKDVVNASVFTFDSRYPPEIQEWCRAHWKPGDSAYVCISRALAEEREDAALYALRRRQAATDSPLEQDIVCHHDLKMLNWVLAQTGYIPVARVAVPAAAQGNLEMLKWLHDHQFPEVWPSAVLSAAAKHGHLEIVQWLHANRADGCSSEAMVAAARSGHLHVLQFMCTHWPYLRIQEAMNKAAEHGHLNIVQWLHSTSTSNNLRDVLGSAASGGHLDIVMWLHKQFEGYFMSTTSYVGLEIAHWLYLNGYSSHLDSVATMAGRRGDLPWLKSLHALGLDVFTWNGVLGAADEGHLRVIAWLHERYPDQVNLERVSHRAKLSGKQHVVDWVRAVCCGSGRSD
ncbi:hypothetical protein Poli38472_003628 [Pythium oligandrum]|uniref:Ankyrin repeat-containing domain n=1 Tax=Pythium oligandrum TaxID=41045 RepID=A0A8K1FPQ7_PYTOL|nr:hypothetical protein Poli38472_003628 [Pythium oligandrum]|eukprot:TMW65863.1 hypothetical protein Poli38472_003628 [Pythium oligandrum]